MKRSTIPVKLIRIKDEPLTWRAQAKQLIALFRGSEEIVLDFNGIDSIGPEFADEIFRVFKDNHPHTAIRLLDSKADIEKTIQNIKVENIN